jgi:hypothetical protein
MEPTLALNEESPRGRESTRGTDLWSADLVGRPTGKPSHLARFFVRTLLGRPPCHICGQGPVLRQFGSSGGLVDPHDRV